MNITDDELQALRETKNDSDWSQVCEEIKAARNGGYPPDWWPKVMASGLMDEIRQGWDDPEAGLLTAHGQNPDGSWTPLSREKSVDGPIQNFNPETESWEDI